MLLDAQEHFRIVVSRSVGLLLPRQRNNHSRILLARRGQMVTSMFSRDLDARPLAPQVDSRRRLDHFVDVSAAHARRTLQKIEMPIGMRLDEFGVGYSSHQSQRRNQFAMTSRKLASSSLPRGTVNVVNTPPPCATFMGGLPYLLTLAKTTSFSETTESTW